MYNKDIIIALGNRSVKNECSPTLAEFVRSIKEGFIGDPYSRLKLEINGMKIGNENEYQNIIRRSDTLNGKINYIYSPEKKVIVEVIDSIIEKKMSEVKEELNSRFQNKLQEINKKLNEIKTLLQQQNS